jgi:hypothetical protein
MNNTEIGLLISAAKAIGWEHFPAGSLYSERAYLTPDGKTVFASEWNPLEEDGAAHRLMVALRMRVRVDDYGASARVDGGGPWFGCPAHVYGGIEAATRVAIVSVAAAEADKQAAVEAAAAQAPAPTPTTTHKGNPADACFCSLCMQTGRCSYEPCGSPAVTGALLRPPAA